MTEVEIGWTLVEKTVEYTMPNHNGHFDVSNTEQMLCKPISNGLLVRIKTNNVNIMKIATSRGSGVYYDTIDNSQKTDDATFVPNVKLQKLEWTRTSVDRWDSSYGMSGGKCLPRKEKTQYYVIVENIPK